MANDGWRHRTKRVALILAIAVATLAIMVAFRVLTGVVPRLVVQLEWNPLGLVLILILAPVLIAVGYVVARRTR